MTRRFPAWLAVALVALGPGALGAGPVEAALQFAQLAANGAPGIVTTVALGRWPDGQSIAVTPFADDAGVQLDLNIWSSSQDSLLGGRQKAGAPSRKINLFHMNVVLGDRESGKTLWQGDAYCEMRTADPARIAGSMVAPLVASLGRSVKARPFDIE